MCGAYMVRHAVTFFYLKCFRLNEQKQNFACMQEAIARIF